MRTSVAQQSQRHFNQTWRGNRRNSRCCWGYGRCIPISRCWSAGCASSSPLRQRSWSGSSRRSRTCARCRICSRQRPRACRPAHLMLPHGHTPRPARGWQCPAQGVHQHQWMWLLDASRPVQACRSCCCHQWSRLMCHHHYPCQHHLVWTLGPSCCWWHR